MKVRIVFVQGFFSRGNTLQSLSVSHESKF